MSAILAQGSPFDRDDPVARLDAGVARGRPLEDVEDPETLRVLARGAAVHERADPDVRRVDRGRVAEVGRAQEARVRVLEQLHHLGEQRVDLEGIVGLDDEWRVLVADRVPVEAVELRVDVEVTDPGPDVLEERDPHLLGDAQRVGRERRGGCIGLDAGPRRRGSG